MPNQSGTRAEKDKRLPLSAQTKQNPGFLPYPHQPRPIHNEDRFLWNAVQFSAQTQFSFEILDYFQEHPHLLQRFGSFAHF
jgi:hypothetical protein